MRDKLGLNPLLACLTYPPEQVTERGVDNLSTLIELGFDLVVSAPAPQTWRKLMREAFGQFTNWARSTELALFTSVPQLAIRYEHSADPVGRKSRACNSATSRRSAAPGMTATTCAT